MADSTLLELVELPDGAIALKRVDDDRDDSHPLVKIRFSDETEFALDKIKMVIARAMIEAGIDAYAELSSEFPEDDEEEHRIIH